ncbi:hypothetical protein [Scopulibacillus darangshiensis]|uniref:hypothetical protein n=1 Tax=Scopulibacillus darangshiensis TaxID=442528 RepID=UPI00104772E2|nr:hypothetical protein [Scopulibacillus darangshiensis]
MQRKNSNIKEIKKTEVQAEDVISVQVHSLSGITRLFKITDGYEERVIRKVTEWINDSGPIKGTVEVPQNNPTAMKMSNPAS